MKSENKRVRVWALLCVGSFAIGLAACGEKQQNETVAAPGKPQVALVMKSLANEFFKTMEEGAREFHQGRADEFELIANGTQSEEDVAGQVNLVEQMIAKGVDAIVIAPADSRALAGVLGRAMKEGIVVVNIDNKLDGAVLAERGLRIPFVGPDNRKGAKLAADHLAKQLQPGDPVAILEGIPSAFNAVQRKQGFVDGANEAGLKIVASQSANWEMAQANQIASGIINEHPEVKAFLCSNDSMALGAVAAIRDAGRAGQIKVIGFDNIQAVQDLIRSGDVLCTVDQHADRLAVFGIEYALEMLKENAAPEDRETPVDLITAEQLAPAAE